MKKPKSLNDKPFVTLQDNTLRVRFCQVGQGDTIILEVMEEGHLNLGIVDCKNEDGENAVISYLDYLSKCKVQFRIAFLILSHPHQDHYSGVAILLEYIKINNISIERIGHNLNIHRDYPQQKGTVHKTVAKIRNAIRLLRLQRSTPKVFFTNIASHTRLHPNINVIILAPEGDEIDEYIDKTTMHIKKYKKLPPAQLANLLSTVIAVTNGKNYLLLTSDTEKKCFFNLSEELNKALPEQLMFAAQIPHHGSEHNFHDDFWKNIKKHPNATAVLSVGNNDPKHPSPVVFSKLIDFVYNVRKTAEPTKKYIRKNSGPLLIEISDLVDDGRHDTIIEMGS